MTITCDVCGASSSLVIPESPPEFCRRELRAEDSRKLVGNIELLQWQWEIAFVCENCGRVEWV